MGELIPPAPLGIRQVRRRGSLVLELTGELDLSNEERLLDALDNCEAMVAVDTTGLTFMDTRGLMTLIAARDRIGTDRFELILSEDGPVHRLLRLGELVGTDNFRTSIATRGGRKAG